MSYQQPPDPQAAEQTPGQPGENDDPSTEAPLEYPERQEPDYETPGSDSPTDDG